MKLSVTPGGPLRGEAAIPGDKSCSHRALILGAMAMLNALPASLPLATDGALGTQVNALV